MMHYLRLPTLEDVNELLWADGPTALLIAGGTDILVRPEPFANKKILIDIGRVKALKGIGLDEQGGIRIGSLATHQEIADDPLIRRRARPLSLACASVGSLQIRNRGTIGGNLGNASPAADSVPALACLDAEVFLVGRNKRRSLGVLSFFKGPGETVREFDEVIESIRIPWRKGRKVAFFKKAGQRKGMCCSKASVALYANRNGEHLADVRIAMGAVAPTVLRVPEAEQALDGFVLSADRIRRAATACSEAVRAIDDIRSTAVYRRHVVGALLSEGLLEILDHLRRLRKQKKRRRR